MCRGPCSIVSCPDRRQPPVHHVPGSRLPTAHERGGSASHCWLLLLLLVTSHHRQLGRTEQPIRNAKFKLVNLCAYIHMASYHSERKANRSANLYQSLPHLSVPLQRFQVVVVVVVGCRTHKAKVLAFFS